MGSTQYYEKNSGLFALFQNAPIYAHVNFKADCVILFKKNPSPGITLVQIFPENSNFAQELMYGVLHNIMKRIPVFLPYFKMPLFTPMLMLKPTVLFYLKRPKPGNNSGPNCPRELKFCTRTQVWGLHNIMKGIPVFLPYFKMRPIYAHVYVKADCVILFKKAQARE